MRKSKAKIVASAISKTPASPLRHIKIAEFSVRNLLCGEFIFLCRYNTPDLGNLNHTIQFLAYFDTPHAIGHSISIIGMIVPRQFTTTIVHRR